MQEEMRKEGLDLSMVTYVSCSIAEQRRLMSELKNSPRPATKSYFAVDSGWI